MELVECNTCKGRYLAVQADGLRYFHTCPSLSVAEMIAAHAAGKLGLSTADAARLATAKQLDQSQPVPAPGVSREQVFWSGFTVARLNARDENIQSTAEKDAGKMKANGTGTKTVSVPDPPVVKP
jgi:hypothetical protein